MIRAECVEQKVTGTMRRRSLRLGVSLSLSALLSLGCTSARPATPVDLANANDTGRLLGPRTETEREILRALPTLPSSAPRTVMGALVTAEPPYTAASGRTCRGVKIGAPTERRLACSNGQTWFFVPGVFWDAE